MLFLSCHPALLKLEYRAVYQPMDNVLILHSDCPVIGPSAYKWYGERNMELIDNRKTGPLIILLLRVCLGFLLIAAAVILFQAQSIPYQIISYVTALLGAALIIGLQIKKISLVSCIALLILAFSIPTFSKTGFLFSLKA